MFLTVYLVGDFLWRKMGKPITEELKREVNLLKLEEGCSYRQ